MVEFRVPQQTVSTKGLPTIYQPLTTIDQGFGSSLAYRLFPFELSPGTQLLVRRRTSRGVPAPDPGILHGEDGGSRSATCGFG